MKRRRPRRNEYAKKPPTPKEIVAAKKLAKKVSKNLFEMMEADVKETAQKAD